MSEGFNNFIFYKEWLNQIRLLACSGDFEDVASLCDGLEDFLSGEDASDMTPMATLVYNQMTAQIMRDKKQYEEISQARSEAGKKGAEAKRSKAMQNEANASKAKQTEANASLKEEEEEDDDVSPNGDNTLSVSEREIKDEFESIWLAYPRKVGKRDAYRHYKAARKSGTTFDEVYNGVLKYRKSVSNTDEQYIAHGSAWFCGHRWEDDISGTPRAKPTSQMTAEEILAIPAINPWRTAT